MQLFPQMQTNPATDMRRCAVTAQARHMHKLACHCSLQQIACALS